MKIRITAGDVTAEAELADTPTGRKIAEALPIEASASTWGDEIYFADRSACTVPLDLRAFHSRSHLQKQLYNL